MAKSMRSKREKRLRAIRREMVGPLVDQKDAAKLAALAAALAAPKLPAPASKTSPFAMDLAAEATTNDSKTTTNDAKTTTMDVEMEGEGECDEPSSSKPFGRKLKKKLKLARNKSRGKGKFKKRHI